jgi:hypothetical protein
MTCMTLRRLPEYSGNFDLATRDRGITATTSLTMCIGVERRWLNADLEFLLRSPR